MNFHASNSRVASGRTSRTTTQFLIVFIAVPFFLAACGVDLQNPPRLATATAQASTSGQAGTGSLSAGHVIELPAPTSTPTAGDNEAATSPGGDLTAPPNNLEGDGLTIWVDEASIEHKTMLDEMAADFADQHGTNVAIQLVSPALLPELVNTAVLSGTLPDIIIHPLEYTAGWVGNGVLDVSAAGEVIRGLDSDTFDPAALEMVTVDGEVAAIPSDGYHQLIIYRQDWFDDLNLSTPDTFAAMAEAAERIFNPENIVSGLVIPTESNLVTTHQAFEQLALANGCRLIADSGEVTILDPVCQAAIEHYFTTINRYSPSGVQTDTSAAIALLTGRTGMIMTSPAILPDLAGLDPSALPSCAECESVEDGINYLARNIGIVTEIRGSSGTPTAFGNIRSLGITTAADRQAAAQFAEYWFDEAYERWLAIDSERKVPMRLGTVDEPRRFIDNWGSLPLGESQLTLNDIYGEETVARLRDGIASAPRWGIREGYGELVSQLYNDFVVSIVLQEMLSGYFDTTTTLREAYRRTVELIPNYSFPDMLAEEEEE